MLERQARNKYLVELGSALVLYMVVLFFAMSYGGDMEPGLTRTLLIISPMVPVALVLWAIARHVRRMDEFVRLRTLESMAIGSGVAGAFSLTYGFLEIAGFPKLSMFWVWGVLGASSFVVAVVRWLVRR